MIKYQLRCRQGHEFDGWFRCSNTFEVQAATHAIECPLCGSVEVAKSIMAPKVVRSRPEPRVDGVPAPSDLDASQREIAEVLRKFRAEVAAKSEFVGRNFASEARSMHYNDKPKRDIWGQATCDETRDLIEEEIPFMPLPRLPEDSD